MCLTCGSAQERQRGGGVLSNLRQQVVRRHPTCGGVKAEGWERVVQTCAKVAD